jgi:hypothetical protein
MKTLVKILLRQARKAAPSNPYTWLESLQVTKWTDVNAQNGQIIGVSVNGKYVSLQALPGTSIADLMAATEEALACLEAGLSSPSSETVANFR